MVLSASWWKSTGVEKEKDKGNTVRLRFAKSSMLLRMRQVCFNFYQINGVQEKERNSEKGKQTRVGTSESAHLSFSPLSVEEPSRRSGAVFLNKWCFSGDIQRKKINNVVSFIQSRSVDCSP